MKLIADQTYMLSVEPLDTTPAQAPEPVTSFVPKRSMATSAAKTIVPPKVDRASNPGSMKLGHKTKFDGQYIEIFLARDVK
jgi:hypothetical protein